MMLENREEPETPEDLVNILENCLRDFPVELAFVFGSRAKGEEKKSSDLDVAVKFEREISKDRRIDLMDRITSDIISEFSIDKVDLIDLDNSDLEIAYSAVSEGELILGGENQAREVKERLQHLYWDFKPVKEEYRESMKNRIEAGTYGRA